MTAGANSDADDVREQPGPTRQRNIYMEGLADITPDLPVSYEELEAAALDAMDDGAAGYVGGGAGGEETMDANREAFQRWRIVPRMLRDVEERDRSVEVLGQELAAPVVFAPIGVLSIVHDEAEIAVAEAAADLDLPMCLSTVSSYTLEEVAETLDASDDDSDVGGSDDGSNDGSSDDGSDHGGTDVGGTGWFQLYWSSDRAVTESLIDRAEAAGYEALVVTVDTPLLSWRERDIEDAYLPFLDGEGLANYFSDPAFLDRLDVAVEENELAAIREFIDVFGDPSLTWDDLEWLVGRTDLPVVVKGILHPDDAQEAIDRGAQGVVVSNHGGRQVDRAVPALEMLPEVVDRVGEEADVLFDSGIRRGSDAIVALALGADAVLLGRPYVYGLALDGADGVREVGANFLADLDLTLGLAGQRSISGLDRSILREQ